MEQNWFDKKDGWKDTTLVWDIETTPTGYLDKPLFRVFGAYSYKYNKFYKTTDVLLMRRLLDEHAVHITFNGKDFDKPVLYDNFNREFNDMDSLLNYKTHVDLYEVLLPRALPGETRKGGKGRAAIMGECMLKGIHDNRFPNYALSTVIKHIHDVFDVQKQGIQKEGGWITSFKIEEFDYNKFISEETVRENWTEIQEYLHHDIKITKELFEFLDNYFDSFKDYLSTEQINKFQHINTSTGSFAYKAMCNSLGLEEKYGSEEKEKTKFKGAFVEMPTKEEWTDEDGDGYCCDFNSQHPHHQWSAGLFTTIENCQHKVEGKCPNPYNGDGKIFILEGTYCGCAMGEKEKWLRSMYFLRLFYKRKYIIPNGKEIKYKECKIGDKVLVIDKITRDLIEKTLTEDDVKKAHELAKTGTDPREYAIKIIINSSYGISSSPNFINIYTPFTGADTTTMSRQSTAFMKEWFEEGGYLIAAGDTDSLYIYDPYKDKERLLKYIAEGIKQIKDVLPFVDATYNMGIDAEFSHIFFFADLPDTIKGMNSLIENNTKITFKKKNYVYITKDNKIKIVGLPIIKGDASLLGKNIFKKYLYTQIIEDKTIKFDKDYLEQLIEIELKENPLQAAIMKKCNTYESYERKYIITLQKKRDKKKNILIKKGMTEEEAEIEVIEWMKDRPQIPTALQAVIAKEYGEGRHHIIKNNKYGIGKKDDLYVIVYNKDKTLTTDAIKLLKEVKMIDVSKTWTELTPFLETNYIINEFKEVQDKKKQEKINTKKDKAQTTLLDIFTNKKVVTKVLKSKEGSK